MALSRGRSVVKPGSSVGAAALVLASGWRLQYKTLRCAAQCFDRVFVLGTAESRPLTWSSACASWHVLPQEASEFDAEHIPLVNQICRQRGIAYILPSDAPTTRFVAQHRRCFASQCYPVPDTATFDLLDNKHSFAQACHGLGVPVPQTRLIADRLELRRLLAANRFEPPLVVKPVNLWGGRGVHLLSDDNAASIAATIDYRPILVQQFVPGIDLCAFYACSNGTIQAETIYQISPHRIDYVQNARIRSEALKIIEHFHYDGVIGFDVRKGPHGLFFIECNPRFWYNMDLVMLAGLNFVRAGLQPCTRAQLPTTSAQMSMVRPMGLIHMRPGSGYFTGRQGVLLAHLLADLPMAASLMVNRVMRRLSDGPSGWPAVPSHLIPMHSRDSLNGVV